MRAKNFLYFCNLETYVNSHYHYFFLFFVSLENIGIMFENPYCRDYCIVKIILYKILNIN